MSRPPKHGLTGTPTYRSWKSMKTRCSNINTQNYNRYGGRGISYCPEWESFENFLRDMGIRPVGTTLDRIDNDGPYSKDNCRWASAGEQQRNKETFTQPAGKEYGYTHCMDCSATFMRLSPVAKRCDTCKRKRWKKRYATQ